MIGKNIQELRKKKGLTLSELAGKANISKSYLSNIERELNDNPSIQVVEKISTVLGVDFKTLLDTFQEKGDSSENEWMVLINELRELGVDLDKIHEYKTVFEFIKWQNDIAKKEKQD